MAAGTSYCNLVFNDGSNMSVLISTSAAIGVIPTVNQHGTATTTSYTDFTFPRNVCLVDQTNVVGTAGSVSAGQIEAFNIKENRRSGKFLNLETTNLAPAIAHRVVPRICFKAGVPYRFIVSTAQVSA